MNSYLVRVYLCILNLCDRESENGRETMNEGKRKHLGQTSKDKNNRTR